MPLTTKGPRQNARSHSMSANVTPASNMVPGHVHLVAAQDSGTQAKRIVGVVSLLTHHDGRVAMFARVPNLSCGEMVSPLRTWRCRCGTCLERRVRTCGGTFRVCTYFCIENRISGCR